MSSGHDGTAVLMSSQQLCWSAQDYTSKHFRMEWRQAGLPSLAKELLAVDDCWRRLFFDGVAPGRSNKHAPTHPPTHLATHPPMQSSVHRFTSPVLGFPVHTIWLIVWVLGIELMPSSMPCNHLWQSHLPSHIALT